MTYEGASHRLRTSGTETRFDRWLRAARQGLEGVLFVMSKEVHGHKNWSILGMWFDFFQLMAYPLYQGKAFPWRKMPVMTGVISFLGSLNPSAAADQVSPMFKLFTVFMAAAWVAAIIAAAAYSAYAFSIGNFATVAPLKFLRATARLTTAVLFVPLASLLISVYKCKLGEMWSITDIPCYGTEHTLLVALISVLLPFFWIFSLCVSAVFFDRNYRSSNIVARAHGRVAIAMISVKSLLTLVFTVAGDTEPWFLHIFVISVGLLWLWLWITFLPNMTQWYNRTWAAFGGVFTWAALCAALAKLLDDPKSGVAGYVFLIGVPTAAYSGYALAYMRFQSFGRVGTPGGPSLRSAYDVDLRARWLLKDIMAAAQGSDASHGSHKVKARAIQPLRNRSAGRSASAAVGRQQLGSAGRLAQTGGAYGAAARSLSPSRASQYGTSAADTPARRAVSQTPVRSTPLLMRAGVGQGGSMPGNGDTMIVMSQGQAGNPTLLSPPKLVKTKSFSTTDSGDSTSDSGIPRASQQLASGGGGGGGGTGTGVISYAGTGIDWSAAFDDGGDTGSHASKHGKHSEQAVVHQVADLYAHVSSSMPGSSVLNLFHAQFIRVFVGDRDLELAIINQGLEKDPSIDIRFLLFQNRKQLEETASGQPPPGAPGSGHEGHEGGGPGKAGGHHGHGGHGHGHHKGHHTKLTLIERVQFEKLQGESVEFDLKARQAELHFWTQLRSPRPSLPRLHELAEEMSDSIAACTTAYERMLVMRPDSIEVLNAYAVFLLEVKRETTLANRYFDAAEEHLAKHEAAEEAARQKAEAAHAAAEAIARQQAEMAYMMSLVTPSHAGRDDRRGSAIGMFAVASAVSKFKTVAAAHHRNSVLGAPSGFLPGVTPKAGGVNTLAMGADGQLRDARGGVLFAMDAARRAQAAAWFANGGGTWDAEGAYNTELTTSTAGMLSARPEDFPGGSPSNAAAQLSASAAQHTGAMTHLPFVPPPLNTLAPTPRAGLGVGFGVTPRAGMGGGMATAVTPAHGHANATSFGSSSSHHMVSAQQHQFSGHQFMPNGPVPGTLGTFPPALATSPRALQNAIAAQARQQGALSPTGGLRSVMASHRSAGFAPPTLATPAAAGFASGMGNAFSPRGGAGNLTSRTNHSSGNALSPLHTSRHSNGTGAAGNSSKTDDGHEAMFAKNRRGSAAITAYASAIAKVRRASLVAATAADISSGRAMSEKQHAQRRASVDANMIWNVASPRQGATAATMESLTARASEAMRGESAWAAPGTARKKESDGDRTARNAGDRSARRLEDGGAGSPPPGTARKARSEDPKPKQRRPSLLIPGAAGQLATEVDADQGKTGGRGSARDGAAPLAAGAGGVGTKQRRNSIQPAAAAKLAEAAKNEEAAAKEKAAQQAALEEEQNRDRLDKEELEAVKRSAGVSNRAKAEARARKKDAAEAAAASLRMAIKAKAGVAEPSLLLLRRALTVLFGLAAVLNIVGAVVQRSLLEAFSKDMDLLALAVERQLLAEDILRHTHNLVLMNAGVLPRFGAGSGGSALLTANRTYGAISRAAARMDELHRILYMSSSSAAATPEDRELYNRAVLSVRDYSAPTAARPSGAFAIRARSLANLGVEYIGKAGLLVGQELQNITAGEVVGLNHPPASVGGVNSNAWYILSNGPGPLRAALNASTLELADRAENHAQLLNTVDFALAVGSALLTCCVALIVVLPIVGAVKSSTDEIFAIFLALPDMTLKQMERTCKQQITALEKLLAASNVDMQAEQVLVVAINDVAAEVGVDSDEEEGGSVADSLSDVEAAAERKKKSRKQDGDGLDFDKDIQQVEYSEENEVGGAAGGSILFGRGEGRRPGAGHEQSALLSGSVTASEEGSAINIRRDGPGGHVQTSARSTDELASEAASKAIQLTRASSKAQMVAAQQQGRGQHQVQGRTLKPTPSVLEMKTDRERVALIRQMSSALLPGMRAIEEEEVASGNGTPEPGSGKASATGQFSIMQTFGSLSRMGSKQASAFSSFLLPTGQGKKRKSAASREVGISKKGSLAARQFDSSFMMLFKLTARFVWPLVALGAYYGGLWTYEEGTTRALLVLTHAAKNFGQVHVLLAQIDQGVRTLIASAPPISSPSVAFSCNATHLASVLAQTDSVIATANVYQDALLFGSAERGFRTAALTLDPALLNIMLRDGCGGVANMPDDCADRRGFYNGLVGDGLQPALRQFMSLARYTLQLRQDALAQSVMTGGPCPAGVDMSVQPVSDLTGLANTYLRASFYRVLDIVLGLGRSRVSAFVAGHAAMAAVSIILLFFVYMFWILRSIRKMDRDIKRTRGTLLLFPTDVLAGVATFVQMAGGLGSGGAVKAMQDKAGNDAFDSATGGRAATSPLAAMGKAFASAKSTLVSASGRASSGGEKKGLDRKASGKKKTVEAKPIFMGLSRAQRGSSFVAGQTPGQAGVYAVSAAAAGLRAGGGRGVGSTNNLKAVGSVSALGVGSRRNLNSVGSRKELSSLGRAASKGRGLQA